MVKGKLFQTFFKDDFLTFWSKKMIETEFSHVRKQAKLLQERLKEELRLRKLTEAKQQAALPESNDPIYNSKRKEMLKFAAEFHF